MLRTRGTGDYNEPHLSTLSRTDSPTVLSKSGEKGEGLRIQCRGLVQSVDKEVFYTLAPVTHVKEGQTWTLWAVSIVCAAVAHKDIPCSSSSSSSAQPKCVFFQHLVLKDAASSPHLNRAVRQQCPTLLNLMCLSAEGFFNCMC